MLQNLLSLILPLFLALPFITATPTPQPQTPPATLSAVPLPTDCSAYPTGQFLLQATDTGNASINGFGATIEFSRGQDGIRWGRIVIVAENDLAKVTLRCVNSTLQAFVETGVSGFTWENINLSPYPYDAEMLYLVPGGPPVEPYARYVDGVKQDGVFLGSAGVVRWGFKYEPKDTSCCGQDYFEIRLLGVGSQDPSTGKPLGDGEFEGFIKVWEV